LSNSAIISGNMRLAVFSFLFLSMVTASRAQDPLCPKINVTGPSGVTTPGDTLTFAVTLSSTPANIRYFWKVSRGTIVAGQGTQSIVVRSSTEDENRNIEATVSINGLPPGCGSVASEMGPIAPMIIGEPVDSFGNLPRDDVRGRLDVFFQELSNYPHDRGFIVIGLGPRDKPNTSNARFRLIIQHIRFRKFDASRISFALQPGSGVTRTTLWRVPPGAQPPTCERCIFVR